MKAHEVYGHVLSTIAVACAIIVTSLVVRRQFAAAPKRGDGPPTPVSGWTDLTRRGHRIGSTAAPVTILEFADFECPYCRAFTDGALRAIRLEFPKQVAVVFREWPLPYHRYAYPAARAAECAAEQGSFESFHDTLYAQQDSLGVKPFVRFAEEAGVPDTAAFARCANASIAVAAIDSDIVAAGRTGGTGTPTIIINGMLLHELPDSARLESLVKQAMARTAQPKSG